MTKELEEKIHDLVKQNYNENTARCVVALVMPLVQSEITLAEKRGRRQQFIHSYYLDCGKQPSEDEIEQSIKF